MDKIVNKLCGKRYGATYSNGYFDEFMCSGYEYSAKYILYDDKPLGRTTYMYKKETDSTFRNDETPLPNIDDSRDIIINEIIKDNVRYKYTNNEYKVNFSYTYGDKEIIIKLDPDQEYNVSIHYTTLYKYSMDINTHTGKHKLFTFACKK